MDIVEEIERLHRVPPPLPRRCRYCGNMELYGNEGSMKCKFDLKKSDEDAETCPEFFFFAEKK